MPNSKLFLHPSLEESADVISEALRKKLLIVIAGSCKVEYKGRASSTLDWGERIVLVKGDGSVLVHRTWDVQPVNWQPPGSIIQSSIKGRHLQIRSVRLKPKESLEVSFSNVFALLVMDLMDKAEFAMYASEQDMQRAVMTNPELIEEGLKPIVKEKVVEPGFIDVYAIDKNGNIVVIELKRRTATSEDAFQLSRYVEEVRKRSSGCGVRGILVAPSASKKALLLLEKHGLEFKLLSPQKCAEVIKDSSFKRITEFI